MMKLVIVNVLLMTSLSAIGQAQIFPDDLDIVVGEWEGCLTYLDYQTNNPFTMPANLIAEQGKNKYELILKNIYPNEPKANGKEKMKISKNGLRLNNHKVTSRLELENGQTQIQTAYKGKDNTKNALIRYTYIIGKKSFIIKKEVQFNELETWIKRSEFSYVRKE